jgi:3-oxoadipate enol-lactonase
MQPLLDALAAGFDLLSWDHRGFGGSGPVRAPYTMADVAGDVAGLLDAVGWEHCRVFGLSFGGMVAQEFAVTHPERVDRLVLACTSSGGDGGSSYPLHELLELPAEQRAATELTVFDSRWDDRWLGTHPVDRVLADRLLARRVPGSPAIQAARRAQLDARRGHDVWDRLDAITCPTLVACGRYDGIAPPENSAAITSRIRGAELRSYEGGHGFLAQDPAAMQEIGAFLEAEGWE